MNSELNSEVLDISEKLVIVGDSSVGKTSLLLRYKMNSFAENVKPTIGCDYFEKELLI